MQHRRATGDGDPVACCPASRYRRHRIGIPPVGRSCRIGAVGGVLLWAVGSGFLGNNAVAADAAAPDAPSSWEEFIERIWGQTRASAGGYAADARAKAGEAAVKAQRRDFGLRLDGNAQYFPEGLGASDETGFTNLEQRAELRLQWSMLDFLARRGGRIGRAEAEKQLAAARSREMQLEAAAKFVEDSVCSAVTPYRREALQEALRAANDAFDKTQAAGDAPSPDLARAAEQSGDRAFRTRSRAQQELARLRHCEGRGLQLPKDLLALPVSAPSSDGIARLVLDDPRIEQLEAQASASSSEAEALRFDGVQFSVYGGYVAQKRDQGVSSVRSTEPQLGASLTIPLGWSGRYDRRAAEADAESFMHEAAAVQQMQERALEELRHRWHSAAALVDGSNERLEQMSDRLQTLQLRHSRAVPDAPEPWDIALHRAELWLAVDEAWDARSQWLEAVLLWALRAPAVLEDAASASPVPANGLCTPLPRCPQ